MSPVNPNDELRRQKRSLEVRLPLEMISQLKDKLKGDLTAGFYNHLRHMDHLTPAGTQQEAGESQTSDDTFTVVQLTDVHISPDYATVSKSEICEYLSILITLDVHTFYLLFPFQGSATDCGVYVCCYPYYKGNVSQAIIYYIPM